MRVSFEVPGGQDDVLNVNAVVTNEAMAGIVEGLTKLAATVGGLHLKCPGMEADVASDFERRAFGMKR
jgi:hypothetical protein